MAYTVYVLLHVCSIYLVLQTTMPQRSLSVYFSSPVQPSPCAKREGVIDALLYFRFKDRTTSRKKTRSLQRGTKGMCHTFFERTNGHTVRVCSCGTKNGHTQSFQFHYRWRLQFRRV